MSSVWHATHFGLDVPCALKFAAAEVSSGPAPAASASGAPPPGAVAPAPTVRSPSTAAGVHAVVPTARPTATSSGKKKPIDRAI
jgi:hypothetical protein